MSKKSKQVPVKEGYGQGAGNGSPNKNSKRMEQDGQNRLAPADVLYDRNRLMGNE